MLKFNSQLMNAPKALSIAEWKEVMEVPVVRESWDSLAERPQRKSLRSCTLPSLILSVEDPVMSGTFTCYAGTRWASHSL